MDASSRQDIVLSGHFIKDEHCTFTSSVDPTGESELHLGSFTTRAPKNESICISKFLSLSLMQPSFWNHAKVLRLTSMARG